MKKLFVLLLSAAVVACGAVSASADDTYPSPESGLKPGNGESEGSVSSTDSSTGSSSTGNNSSTSPKTGATGSYAVLMAAAALALGGVAVGAKKKIGE